ncbi:DUF3800 domain-containing protein [Corallococcus exercitus]|uniref:DUF3800 domain-containing protein n=1 Tax=Corallococcus exercitus TaxID=2316736 RepID=UPI0035D401F7
MRWLISCDESGTGGSPFYGFGTLWMNWQRRGNFSELIQDLREKHKYEFEIKWNKVSGRNLPFYRDLVEAFFKTSWMHFHCIVVKQADVRLDFHDRDWDLARRKHFTMLLTNKIRRCLTKNPNRDLTFRIWVDPIASRYKKANEAVEIIANNALQQVFKRLRPVDKVITRDSRDTPSIQLCDLLLGAVMEGWQRKSDSESKQELREWIAEHLGWDDLANDTHRDETKFNIWYFHDPISKPKRSALTRPVKLRYPLPTGKRRRS